MTHISVPGRLQHSGSTVPYHQNLLRGPLPEGLLLNCLAQQDNASTNAL